MSAGLAPLRSRIGPIVAVLFGAPIAAEYLQGYMSSTGQALEILASLLILGPLYGGAALLIREVAVRSGMGWAGIALLAAAFGLAMPGLIDLALFAEHRPEISYWDDMRTSTLISPLGISAYSTLSWVSAHVILSVCTPLTLLSALCPQHRNRPLLGRPGIVVLALAWTLAATFIRSDGTNIYGYSPSLMQSAGVAVVVVAIAALAWTPLGKPTRNASGQRPAMRSKSVWLIPLVGAVGMMALDMIPWTWAGTAVFGTLLASAVVALRIAPRRMRWKDTEAGLLAAGALVGRTTLGFFAPLTDGVSRESVVAQNSILLACTVAIAWLVIRRARAERRFDYAAGAE